MTPCKKLDHKPRDKFKNTYINTSQLTLEQINALAKKYSEASGYPLADKKGTIVTWRYLTSVKHKNDLAENPVDYISVTGSLDNLVRPLKELTEITEKDLDDHLRVDIMSKFKNTYIKTSGLAPRQIDTLAKKYSEASGYPLAHKNRTIYAWQYLTSVKHRRDHWKTPLDSVAVADSLSNLVRPPEDLTEITEKDLDDHLNKELNMTPCQKLGYKVGDKFKVLAKTTFSIGSVVELYKDSGDDIPLFKLIKGNCDYSHCSGEAGTYLSLDSVKPFKETIHPTQPFKISLVDLTQDQKASALKWLEETAKANSWDYSYLYGDDYKVNYVWYDTEDFNVATEGGCYAAIDLPELTFSFSTSITSFNISGKKPKEVVQLEELISNLVAKLEEATKALEKIQPK
jgi:hypothetical protein